MACTPHIHGPTAAEINETIRKHQARQHRAALRDRFACAALSALGDTGLAQHAGDVARKAYAIADAMLAERDRIQA